MGPQPYCGSRRLCGGWTRKTNDRGHHRLLGKALVEQDKFLVEEYFVCNACGHVVTREPPEYCQVCGAVRKAFHKVI
jgi:rubrerythrin